MSCIYQCAYFNGFKYYKYRALLTIYYYYRVFKTKKNHRLAGGQLIVSSERLRAARSVPGRSTGLRSPRPSVSPSVSSGRR